VQALIAGNDMLCLPEDVPAAINAIKTAIKKKRLKWKDIDAKVMKVLKAKYSLGLHQPQRIDTTNLLNDLNEKTEDIKRMVARNTVTVLRNDVNLFPLLSNKKMAYIGIGTSAVNEFSKRLQQDFRADTFFFSYKDNASKAAAIKEKINNSGYDVVLIGVHDYSNRPTNNYNISPAALTLWNSVQSDKAVTFLFGNVYAAKNFCAAKTLVALHQDDEVFQQAAADFLRGSLKSIGQLPVTVCNLMYGTAIVLNNLVPVGVSPAWLAIDSVVNTAIAQKAFPGAVVLAVQKGEIKYHKAFGHYDYDSRSLPVTLESIYDLASVTKISATTVSVMKLYEQGKLDLKKTLGDYLPWTSGTNKAGLTIRDVLLHQAGLVPFIAFYKETIDSGGIPSAALYRTAPDTLFTVPVARNLYLRNDWQDTLYQRILKSPLTEKGKYIYSDNDFIFLGKIVEALSGMPLDQYVQKTFYNRLGMVTTGFMPWQRFGVERVVPTEEEKHFRRQLLQGYVHDEGASLFGGVAGHAGLFSDAYDLSLLYQMLLNGGELNGERYLKPETIRLFTAYGSENSRRGLGFDKVEKDNATRKEPYPSALASPETFGHTGFTGTCVWVDPKVNLVYIFLSNRVYPTRNNNKLSSLNVRGSVQDAIYRAIKSDEAAAAATPKAF
ncbi:MAG: serine hydrolase, partial [Bacteroidota bacterium]|nr:serine hydrolase [Bacteroidota bacterium]